MFLTNFQLHNKDVRPGVNSPLKQSITYTKELTLDYNQNFISFDYAVCVMELLKRICVILS